MDSYQTAAVFVLVVDTGIPSARRQTTKAGAIEPKSLNPGR